MTETNSNVAAGNRIMQLMQERDILVAKLTRFIHFVRAATEAQTIELETRLDHASDIFKQFEYVQSQIESLNPDELASDNRESFENSYYKTVSKARSLVSEFRGARQHSFNSSHSANSSSRISLPPIDLPKFDGDYKKWLFFYKRFSALVDHNPQLSNVEKFFYLQGRLQGQAAEIIQHIELTDENYSTALQLLIDRYENKRVIIDKHIDDLFNIPSANSECPTQLRRLIDAFKQHLRALTALGEPTEHWDRLLIQLIKIKLDKNTRDKWQEASHSKPNCALVNSAQSDSSLPTLKTFLDFLVCRCEYLESLDKNKSLQNQLQPNSSNYQHSKGHSNYQKHSRTHTFTATNQSNSQSSSQSTNSNIMKCFYCDQAHGIYKCANFKDLSLNNKYAAIKRLGLCENCLKRGHSKQQCKSGQCRICQKKHNSILHPFNPSETNNSTEVNQTSPATSISTNAQNPQTNNSTVTSLFAHSSNNNFVLLSTAIVHIQDSAGNFHSARALLDVGSQSNYITKELSEKLQLPEQKVNISISGVGQGTTNVFTQSSTIIKSMHSPFKRKLTFLILPKITDHIPNLPFSLNNLNIPPHVQLGDPTLNKPSEIQVLLGASIFYELLDNEQISLGKGKPLLQASKLGWLLAGAIHLPPPQKQQKTFCTLSLNQQLSKFWEVEEIAYKKHLSLEEDFCETHFKETVSRDPSGRFIVKFPLKESINQLGSSKDVALQRLASVERRFQRDPEFQRLYVNFINEYLTLDHMSLVNPDSNHNISFYLPHHGVKKESSTTTKLRVVYDGSTTTDSGISLNHCLGVGPQIQDDLFNIILRFRLHSYIITADIEKMYRMLIVHPEHRRFQRILWRESIDQPIQTYEMSRLAYGLASSSFLATRALHELAIENQSQYPETCRVILKDFYVDDLITGTDSLETILKLKSEISSILRSGGFELRKWASNVKDIIPDQQLDQFLCEKTETKTLGLVWNPNKDTLQYSVNFQSAMNIQVTKRHILSTISKIFDPLGLIGPTTIKAKIMLQKLWQCNSSWDEPVPLWFQEEWTIFVENIAMINNFLIPRHVVCHASESIEIHGFSDASEAAYGCCIYLRSFNSQNHCMQLLCAKSRVAPLKKLTVPRLELCGALLLVRLLKVVQTALSNKINNVYLYTDSKIVLAWIKTQPCYLQTFVANRIVEITENTTISNWHHISSSDNPADLISRGLNPQQLISNDLWWHGPSFFHDPRFHPVSNYDLSNVNVPEMKAHSISLVAQNDIDYTIFERFSSFSKLQRVVAHILRFKHNCLSHSRITGPLTTNELQSALVTLIKLVQIQEFSSEIILLSSNQPLFKSSKLLNLLPFLDKDNILRVGGRIQYSNSNYDHRHPIILPSKHPFTELLILLEHLNNLHASTQLLLSIIRLRYWPLAGTTAVKRVLRKCVICFRAKPVAATQIMGNLPVDRFNTSRPFMKTAVDYAGPFMIKTSYLRNAKMVKSYVCVFVCMSTKALHLELANDLSKDAFLNAFKRFISRRGKPSDIFSDNGTNFVGCHNELKQLYNFLKTSNSSIHDFLSQDNIDWHFLPASSPHMGGLWEAAVKAVKYHLTRIIINDHLTFDQMYTLLVRVEACLNSRPLTPLSNDPLDFSPLTPAHFLIGDSLATLPEVDVAEVPANRLNHYRRLQQIQQHFWSRWSKEYLSQLQTRSKWKSPQANAFKEGALVVLKEDNVPPMKWCLGRIVELFPGKDNVIRVVSVRTPSGTIIKRATAKVCLLPIN